MRHNAQSSITPCGGGLLRGSGACCASFAVALSTEVLTKSAENSKSGTEVADPKISQCFFPRHDAIAEIAAAQKDNFTTTCDLQFSQSSAEATVTACRTRTQKLAKSGWLPPPYAVGHITWRLGVGEGVIHRVEPSTPLWGPHLSRCGRAAKCFPGRACSVPGNASPSERGALHPSPRAPLPSTAFDT